MKYYLKRKINKTLKSIHNFILNFGVDISIVKKEDTVSAIQHNSVSYANQRYLSDEHQYDITSKEHQIFFLKIITLFKEKNIDLNNKEVADVGCGIGNLLSHLNQHYKLSAGIGYDFSQAAIDIAKERNIKADFIQHDIYEPINKSFDFIFCTEVIEHLLFPTKALLNMIIALNPGGILFITVPDGRKDTWSGHINFWSPESWEVFIKENTNGQVSTTGYITSGNLFALIVA